MTVFAESRLTEKDFKLFLMTKKKDQKPVIFLTKYTNLTRTFSAIQRINTSAFKKKHK